MEEPNNRYKISSDVITLDQDISKIERSTFNGLEWLGDVGGLYDAMRLIRGFIVYPLALSLMKAELVSISSANRLAGHSEAFLKL